MGRKVFSHSVASRSHGFITFIPTGGADLAVFFRMLQRVDNSQRFIYVSSQRKVINNLMSDNAFSVYEKKSSQCNGFIEKNIIIEGD